MIIVIVWKAGIDRFCSVGCSLALALALSLAHVVSRSVANGRVESSRVESVYRTLSWCGKSVIWFTEGLSVDLCVKLNPSTVRVLSALKMISHSPPIFSHSPPVSFLSDYMNNHRQHAPSSIYCRPQMMTLASKVIVNNASSVTPGHRIVRGGRSCLDRMASAPVLTVQPKSCLSRKSSNNSSKFSSVPFPTAPQATTANNNHIEKSKTRKKVIFADDEGLSLTEVRVMSEPSNVPPYWSMKFLEQITQGLVSPQPADQWTVDFKQPASDYLSFRQKIEQNFVSLENVIVKDDESIIVGTVKVKNEDFTKEVIVRVTWDDWKSQQDIFCNYARAYGPATNAHVVFDTFSFKITLPPSSKRLEFCICFRVNSKEYWDNNDNKNYTISKRSPFYYNALSPYDKNSSRSSSQSYKLSALSEALANTPSNLTESSPSPEPSPYW